MNICHRTVEHDTTTITIVTIIVALEIRDQIIIIVLGIGISSTITMAIGTTTIMKGNALSVIDQDISPHNAHKRILTTPAIGTEETMAKHLPATNPAHKTNG